MNPQQYQTFIDELAISVRRDSRVLGLVLLGSAANQSHAPDEWSDHDFFLIVTSGEQEQFRQDLTWLPDASRIQFSFRETEHGIKVLYDNGHLLEFAVFDPDEIRLAKVNDYRIVFDQLGLEPVLQAMVHTASYNEDSYYLGQLITHVVVGATRYIRGEQLSGHIFIKHYALGDVLALMGKYLDAPHKSQLDTLDPFRRVEAVYPQYAQRLNSILLQPPIQTAHELLDFTDEVLQPFIKDYPVAAIQTVRRKLATIN